MLLVVILASMLMMTLGTMKKPNQNPELESSEDSEENETNTLDVFLNGIADEKEDLT